jgi:hypothetical protein
MAGETQMGSGAQRRGPRIGVALVISALLLSLVPSFAMAAIKIYDSSASMTYLGEVTKAKCKVRQIGKHRTFFAIGKTTNGAYKLDVGTLEFRGFGQTYNVPYGVQTPSVDLDGISSNAEYSNVFAFPGGQPPGGAGAFAFARRGAQLRLGIYALPNQDYSQGVSLAGGLKCGYPRR